ncbi:tetratricopeptide repeat protein [Inhella proteolytica]|uniref:Tetratricopeptide repeat protein n=1 Tax=Inhella proteolytica TaxID=2795029 RepID=A0A931JA39_9BURK|nr:tetratricopeptide repeat protein [Inhella proteolytica]MBH9579597.1 tetratricopeptide repeat protein [Inhella proteolytica]
MPAPSLRRLLPWALALPLLAQAQAASPPVAAAASAPPPPVQSSALDAPLFYQLLIAELELQRGQPGVAFQVLLDAARRTGDEALFRRVVNVALQARAGNEALQATRAWRQALPESTEALQTQLQLMAALGQLGELPGPLLDWLQQSPDGQARAQHLATLPRLVRQPNAFDALEPGLAAERDNAAARSLRRSLAACVIAQLAQQAGNHPLMLNQLREARQLDADNQLPAWQALDLARHLPAAEELIDRGSRDPAYRLAWARALARDQRSVESLALFQTLAAEQPDEIGHAYAIGSLALDLRQPKLAESALRDYLKRLPESHANRQAAQASALLLLSQALEQQGQLKEAARVLDEAQDPQRALEVAFRRALLQARLGELEQARAAARALPGDGPDIERRRLLAEVQILREANRWKDAHELLGQAVKAEPDNTDLLYEHAMSLERLKQFDDMERQLRRVMELEPRHHHARNALGYSLAERGLRLAEARELIEAALEIGGQEPAIVDSLGWVAFREGKLDEAETLLRRAYRARLDTEIAAHLAEVLWARGNQEEARRLLDETSARDGSNEVLRSTRRRLGLR